MTKLTSLLIQTWPVEHRWFAVHS